MRNYFYNEKKLKSNSISTFFADFFMFQWSRYIHIYIFFYHSLSVVNSLPYLHALFLLLSTCIMYIRECKSTCLGMSLCDNLWYANVWLWRYTFTRVRVRGVRAPLCTTQHKGDKGRIYSQGRKTNIKTKHELCIIWLFFPLF